MNIAKLRSKSAEKGLVEIKEASGRLLFFFAEQLPLEKIPELTSHFKGRLLFSAGTKPYFTLKSDNYMKDINSFVQLL